MKHPELHRLPDLFMTPVPRTRAEWAALDRARIPHCIVFSRDFSSAAGLRRLNSRLIARAHSLGTSPILALDEEGGLVSQLKLLGLEAPGPRVLSLGGTEELAWRSARATAKTLRSLGFNLNFAPVADADSAQKSPVIGARAVSADPIETGEWCAGWIRAHQAEGVAATAKHFPGHGAAEADSHLTLPTVSAPRALLKRRELRPFLGAANAGVAAMMTAHVRYPALDSRLPATLSPRTLRLARTLLGFDGVLVSDSLDMAGVRKFGEGEAAVRALLAGCDLLLYGLPGLSWRKGLVAVERAAKSGRIPRARLEEALTRVDRLADSYPARVAARVVETPARLQREWDEAAARAMRYDGFPLRRGSRIAVTGDLPQAAALASELRKSGFAAASGPLRRPAGGRDGGPSFRLLLIGGRAGWQPAERAAAERLQSSHEPFGLISLLSEARLAEPEARGAQLRICPFEDTARAVRAMAHRISGRRA